jgi:hypothetical protein
MIRKEKLIRGGGKYHLEERGGVWFSESYRYSIDSGCQKAWLLFIPGSIYWKISPSGEGDIS